MSQDSNRCSWVFLPTGASTHYKFAQRSRELIDYICSINLLRNGPSMPEICFREHRLLFRFFPHDAHHTYPKYLWVTEEYRWDKIHNGPVCIVDNFPKTQSKSKILYAYIFNYKFLQLKHIGLQANQDSLTPLWAIIIKE